VANKNKTMGIIALLFGKTRAIEDDFFGVLHYGKTKAY
jgi:hypothetical protein